MTVSTVLLILKLRKIENNVSSLSFKKEKRNVIFTVIVYDFCALIRIVLGLLLYPKIYTPDPTAESQFIKIVTSLACCTTLDLTPIIFVMILHISNFKRQATLRQSSALPLTSQSLSDNITSSSLEKFMN